MQYCGSSLVQDGKHNISSAYMKVISAANGIPTYPQNYQMKYIDFMSNTLAFSLMEEAMNTSWKWNNTPRIILFSGRILLYSGRIFLNEAVFGLNTSWKWNNTPRIVW